MAFLGNLRNVVIGSFVLAILLVGLYCTVQGFDGPPLNSSRCAGCTSSAA